MLFSVCHVPGLSRYNSTEHLLAPCSKWLAGVCFSVCADGENIPPAYQTIVATEKEERKSLFLKRLCQILTVIGMEKHMMDSMLHQKV